MKKITIILIVIALIVVGYIFVRSQNSVMEIVHNAEEQMNEESGGESQASIPLDEILSGGPGKDGIPSIDNPKFVDATKASEYLHPESVGLGIEIDGEARYYPYQILVWHEIVNDEIKGTPVLITYCPLCITGIAFNPVIDGEEKEFGVSGLLWQSNLLMYDRTGNEETESLWSQVLGEAVVGPSTGTVLEILESDPRITFGDWAAKHPDTKVLSMKTGYNRDYEQDPYGDYYTNPTVSFGATFNDSRIDPKAFVLGVRDNGAFKAYPTEALPVGTTTDTFAGKTLTITKKADNSVRIYEGSEMKPIEYIGGFWFSWLAVHPDTLLYGE